MQNIIKLILPIIKCKACAKDNPEQNLQGNSCNQLKIKRKKINKMGGKRTCPTILIRLKRGKE